MKWHQSSESIDLHIITRVGAVYAQICESGDKGAGSFLGAVT